MFPAMGIGGVNWTGGTAGLPYWAMMFSVPPVSMAKETRSSLNQDRDLGRAPHRSKDGQGNL